MGARPSPASAGEGSEARHGQTADENALRTIDVQADETAIDPEGADLEGPPIGKGAETAPAVTKRQDAPKPSRQAAKARTAAGFRKHPILRSLEHEALRNGGAERMPRPANRVAVNDHGDRPTPAD